MDAIFTWFGSLFEAIYSLVRIALWAIQGVANFAAVLVGSVNTLARVVDFLPGVVASGIMGAIGILVTLRIVGRS